MLVPTSDIYLHYRSHDDQYGAEANDPGTFTKDAAIIVGIFK